MRDENGNEFINFNMRISPEMIKTVKIIAVEQNVSASEIVRRAINDYLKNIKKNS